GGGQLTHETCEIHCHVATARLAALTNKTIVRTGARFAGSLTAGRSKPTKARSMTRLNGIAAREIARMKPIQVPSARKPATIATAIIKPARLNWNRCAIAFQRVEFGEDCCARGATVEPGLAAAALGSILEEPERRLSSS